MNIFLAYLAYAVIQSIVACRILYRERYIGGRGEICMAFIATFGLAPITSLALVIRWSSKLLVFLVTSGIKV